MKKNVLRSALFSALLMILWLPALVQAASLKSLSLSFTALSGNSGEMPSTAVNWYAKSGTYYVFLPGCTDWGELRVWFEGASEEITIAGQTLKSGDRLTGITEPCELTVLCGKSEYKLSIMQGSAIAACMINTESGSLKTIHSNQENKEGGTCCFLRPDGSCDYDGELAHIKLRGNTSTTLSKKNYGFKLEKGADLMGLGKAKRWVLLGSYRDHAQLRNQIVYNMASYVGLRYTPDTTPVDLYLNHDYYGTYLLTEKIEVNEDRVDITDLEKATEAVNEKPLEEYKRTGSFSAKKGAYKAYQIENDPEDITGGYIIEYENYQPRYKSELCAYTTKKGKVLLLKAPEIASVAQVEYISSFMQGYENAIFAEDGIDPDSGKRYDEFVDFESLVLKYMLEEVSMNCDGNASSQYYVKPSDSESKVAYAGPAWDYDITFGDWASGRKANLLNPETFLHNKVDSSLYWWPRLYQKAEFFSAVREKWESCYSHALNILLGRERDESGKLLSIDEYAAAIESSAEMNFIRWPIGTLSASAKKEKEEKGESYNLAETGKSFSENVEYLKNFVEKRYAFLDKEWGSAEEAGTPEI